METPLPMGELIENLIDSVGKDLAKESLSGVPLDKLEERIVRDAFERLMRENERAIAKYFKR